jgi:RimJ/RimL family protein N-acetyltransferase
VPEEWLRAGARKACEARWREGRGSTLLEGEKVRLRAREPSDAEAIWRWLNDREVQRTMGGRYPWSLAAEVEWLRERAPRPIEFGADIGLAIETKEGRLIGTTGLHGASPENRDAWLGIMIGEKDCWSQGYGTDAIVTLLRLAFGEMGLHRVELQVYADNARGIACYRNCGFVEEVRMRQYRLRAGVWVDALTMGVLHHEFAAVHGLSQDEARHA